MKKFYALMLCAVATFTAQAQWTKTTTSPTSAKAITGMSSQVEVLPSGASYVSGNLSKDGVTFGTTTLNFQNVGDSYIYKYTAAGEPAWATTINGESTRITAMTSDEAGNLYVAGVFSGEASFANIVGEAGEIATLFSALLDDGWGGTFYGSAGFLAKYSSEGALLGVQSFAPTATPLPDGAFSALLVTTQFYISNLAYSNGKLFGAVTYAGIFAQNGVEFTGRSANVWDMGFDLVSGAVVSFGSDLTVASKLADLAPVATDGSGVYAVKEVALCATDTKVYALFGAVGKLQFTAANDATDYDYGVSDSNEDFGRGYLLLDLAQTGALNAKKSYASELADPYDDRNDITSIALMGDELTVAGFYNESLPFVPELAPTSKIDFYVAKFNTTTLELNNSYPANMIFPTVDDAALESMAITTSSGTSFTDKLYGSLTYEITTKVDDADVKTYTSTLISFSNADKALMQTNASANQIINGLGSCGYNVVEADNNIISAEFDETELSVSLLVEAPAGMEDATADKAAITLYPNPVADVVNFSASCDVVVYNAQGALVKRAEAVQSLNVTSLVAGIYHVVATSAEGTATLKFIKK